MKKSIIFFSIILTTYIGCLFTSCKITPKDVNTIAYDSIVVRKQIPLLEVNDSTKPYADIDVSFTYPTKFRTAEDLLRLQEIFIGTFFSNVDIDNLSPQAAMDLFINDYESDYKSLSETYYEEVKQLSDGNTPMWYWYYMNLNNKIVYQNEALLSYAVHYSDYTGGAHGSYYITYTNIDLNSLTTITEEDLFAPNYQKKLADIIINRLMIQNNVSTKEELLEIGYFDIDDIFPNKNFWLNDEGIHYAFNQYEIAPYVMGVTEVDIPYEDLTEILNPNFQLAKLFPNIEK